MVTALTVDRGRWTSRSVAGLSFRSCKGTKVLGFEARPRPHSWMSPCIRFCFCATRIHPGGDMEVKRRD